jgi:pyruvate/2-oxoglutarate dehydrogenase complex dihydrolipoamide acyltransferase (E2) component
MQTGSVDSSIPLATREPGAAWFDRPVCARPEIRELAGRLGVDLASLAGSGPGGAIARADVLRAAGDVTGLVRPPRMEAEEALEATINPAR